MPRSARATRSQPEPDVPKEAPPRMKVSLVQIRAEDVLPGDVVWLAKGPRMGAWRLVRTDITQSGTDGRVDIPFTNGTGVNDTASYGRYDLVKLQILKEL